MYLNEWVRVSVGSKKEDNDIVPSNPCIAGSLFQVSNSWLENETITLILAELSFEGVVGVLIALIGTL